MPQQRDSARSLKPTPGFQRSACLDVGARRRLARGEPTRSGPRARLGVQWRLGLAALCAFHHCHPHPHHPRPRHPGHRDRRALEVKRYMLFRRFILHGFGDNSSIVAHLGPAELAREPRHLCEVGWVPVGVAARPAARALLGELRRRCHHRAVTPVATTSLRAAGFYTWYLTLATNTMGGHTCSHHLIASCWFYTWYHTPATPSPW